MDQERLDLLRSTGQSLDRALAGADEFTAERLGQIDTQLPLLLRRHQLIRNALLFVYDAIVVFVASMLVIAVATITQSDYVAFAALVVFLLGMGAFLIGMLITSNEVAFEVGRVLDLGK